MGSTLGGDKLLYWYISNLLSLSSFYFYFIKKIFFPCHSWKTKSKNITIFPNFDEAVSPPHHCHITFTSPSRHRHVTSHRYIKPVSKQNNLTFLIEDFFHLRPVSTTLTPVVHL